MAVEHREYSELRFSPEGPEGPDDGTLPRTFRLDSFTSRQRRDGRQKMWLDETQAQRTLLAGNITRTEAAGLIGQLADWLAWDGPDT